MPNTKNLEIVKNLKEKLAKAKSIIFMDYQGLNANQVNDLRMKISDSNAEVAIVKNTLLKIALKESDVKISEIESYLTGPTAAVISYEDVIVPIKVLFDFAKKIELPKIKAAIIEGGFASLEKVKALSEIPSREVLLANFVGTLQRPLLGLVTILNGTQRNLVCALSAITAKKKGVS